MARPTKVSVAAQSETTDELTEIQKKIEDLFRKYNDLTAKIEERFNKPKQQASINKTEEFNGERDSGPREEGGLRLTQSDKIVSAKNAVKILPPNLVVEGRHTKENISAICGFVVDEDMMDVVYEDFVHSD